jgi:hypothetical protein
MRLPVAVLALLLSATTARGTGWNDFVQPIGDGYSIVRASAVVLTHENGVLVGDDSQPVVAFAVTPTCVFVKTNPWGGTPNFHVVKKSSGTAVGPLTAEAFTADPDVVGAGALNWQVPTNPHPEVARDGQRMFMAFMVVVYGTPILLCVAVVGLIIRWSRRHARSL